MKRIVVALVIIGLFVPVASAQEPEKLHRVYLPQVSNDMPRQICTRPWRLIEPEGSTNLVLNPSAEIAGNYGAAGGGAVARVTTYQHYGLYSYEVTTAANGDGISLTTATLAASAHFVTLRVHGTLPPAWRVGIAGNLKAPRLIERVNQDWALYGIEFSAAEASGAAAVTVTQSGAGAAVFYVDAVQVEESGHWSTFIDGTQPGCSWNGAEHAATSTRSAAARTGGRPRDFQERYGFFVEEMVGTGTAPVTLDVRGYSILPGGELAGSKLEPREFSLIGVISAKSKQELHAKRQRLSGVLLGAGGQPIRLQYSGAETQKFIDAIYSGGLEAELPVTYDGVEFIDDGWQKTGTYEEKVALQFMALDPAFYEVGESVATLDTRDPAALRYVTGRLKATGQWDNLGLAANPIANGPVYTIAIGPDGNIYIGGQFTGLNGTVGAASIDYVGMYNPHTDTWSQVGNAGDFTDIVYVLKFGPDGTLYAGGRFNVAGGSVCDYLGSWNGAAWATVGVPVAGAAVINQVEALAWGLDGILYVGGTFQNWANIAAADYIVKWDGAAYTALGTGMNLTVTSVATHPNGNIFAGGSFTTAGGGAAQRIAEWDVNASTWSAVGVGFNNIVQSLAIDDNGFVFIGGNFTDLFGGGGGNYNYIAKWNGQTYEALGKNNGTDGTVWSVAHGPDGYLFAAGVFSRAGDIDLADCVARWNGSSWAHLDINLPGAPTVRGLILGASDPGVTSNYDVFLGFSTTGTGNFAGLVTVDNDGGMIAYPKIIVERSGGTLARLETVRNETLGLVLLFNYSLLDGERLTIDLAPTQKSIVSNFFGPRPDAILANSDFGQWNLKSGDNDVTAFVNVAGAPTITSWLLWRDAYSSLD